MYDAIFDIRLSLDGDLVLDGGDVAVTSGLDWYRREANKRLRSGADWAHHPSLGANLASYVGLSNTSQTGQMIKDACLRSLSVDAIHFPAHLDVQVVPTSFHDLHTIVTLSAQGKRNVVGHVLLDFVGGRIDPVEDLGPRDDPVVASPYTIPDNQYLKRLRK